LYCLQALEENLILKKVLSRLHHIRVSIKQRQNQLGLNYLLALSEVIHIASFLILPLQILEMREKFTPYSNI